MAEYKKDTHLAKIRELTELLNVKETELVYANKKLVAMLEHSPLGMMITVNRVIAFANQTMCNLVQYEKESLEYYPIRVLYDTDDEYNRIGELIKQHREFTTPVVFRLSTGEIKEFMLKFTRFDEENFVSVYIEGVA